MEENQFFLDIVKGKRFIISDIEIDDTGRVSYNMACLDNITEDDRKIVDDFFKKMISESQQ